MFPSILVRNQQLSLLIRLNNDLDKLPLKKFVSTSSFLISPLRDSRKMKQSFPKDTLPPGFPVVHIFTVISDFVRKKNSSAGFG